VVAKALFTFLLCAGVTLHAAESAEEQIVKLSELAKENAHFQQVLNSMISIAKRESILVQAPQHTTQFRIQTDGQGRILEDRPVVLLIHGLSGSPLDMIVFEELAWSQGAHVITFRLPGHHQMDPRDLDKIKWQEWWMGSLDILDIAHELSPHITLLGHSLGGAIAIGIAAAKPEKVEHLVVLAPSFKLNTKNIMAAMILPKINVTGASLDRLISVKVSKDYDYVSSFAAYQQMAFEKFLAKSTWSTATDTSSPSNQSQDLSVSNYSNAITRIQDLDITWLDTEVDSSIDNSVNSNLVSQIQRASNKIYHYIFPASENVSHDDLATDNPYVKTVLWPLLENQMSARF
jgi:esterase/lipase